MKVIHFNSSSIAWSKDMTNNRYFVLTQLEYLQRRLQARGYIYLSEVYEAFGAAWDPDNVNVCYRESEGFIPDMLMKDDEIIITIN